MLVVVEEVGVELLGAEKRADEASPGGFGFDILSKTRGLEQICRSLKAANCHV